MAYYGNQYGNFGGYNGGMMQGGQSYTPSIQQAQNAQNNIIWVQGVEGAKAHQMTPRGIAILLDSENNGRFYIKTCDEVGMCSLRYFSYTEDNDAPSRGTDIDTSQFVTKTELNGILTELKEGMKREQPVQSAQSTPKFSTNQHPSNDFKR